VITHLRAY